jgi:DNA-binding LacI/PurR family transcriptional regulator
MAAASELGYASNAMARGLITRRSNLVAVIISNLTNLYYPEVLGELTQRLSDLDMRVLLFALKTESDVVGVLDQIWRYQVDGCIAAVRLSDDQLRQFDRRGVALVLYNRTHATVPVASVCCEFAGGERLLVDGLVGAGRRHFAIVGGPEDSTVGEARVQSAFARIAAAGLKPPPIARGDFSYASGRRAFHELRKDGSVKLDAIIAANDVMALGVMDGARLDCRLKVPENVAVVGFDGVAPATWASYQLTTVRQPVGRMTQAAVSMLMERIEDPTTGPERRSFSGELLRGASAILATV